jgi:hypothetical protein
MEALVREKGIVQKLPATSMEGFERLGGVHGPG